MAKPEQAQPQPKGKGEGEAKKEKPPVDENMKIIIINLVTTVLICILFLSVTYVMLSNLMSSKLSKLSTSQADNADSTGDATANDSSDEVPKGFIVDLGDFILNLSDISPRKFLKVNVALEVSSKPEDATPPAKKEGGEGGKGGPAASPLDDEMAQYKPAIRDAVITTLSSKTSAELSTVAGKELAKEQITEAVNGLFAGSRDVLRVSFGQFIIQ